jgi:hypothetical protein
MKKEKMTPSAAASQAVVRTQMMKICKTPN